jgi:hypothetical protein
MATENSRVSPILVSLQRRAAENRISHVFILIAIVVFFALIIDYARMLRLRSKMVTIQFRSKSMSRTNRCRTAASWAFPTSDNWQHLPTPRYQTVDLL